MFSLKILTMKSNLIEIQRIETAAYSNKAYFPGEHFLYFWEIKRFCNDVICKCTERTHNSDKFLIHYIFCFWTIFEATCQILVPIAF